MPRYLVTAKFTPTGLAGRRAEGFASGAAQNAAVWESVGGSVEAWYYAPATAPFDVYAIVTAPSSDAVFAVANAAMTAGALVSCDAIELRTGAEADAALVPVAYRAPAAS